MEERTEENRKTGKTDRRTKDGSQHRFVPLRDELHCLVLMECADDLLMSSATVHTQ